MALGPVTPVSNPLGRAPPRTPLFLSGRPRRQYGTYAAAANKSIAIRPHAPRSAAACHCGGPSAAPTSLRVFPSLLPSPNAAGGHRSCEDARQLARRYYKYRRPRVTSGAETYALPHFLWAVGRCRYLLVGSGLPNYRHTLLRQLAVVDCVAYGFK